MYRVVAPYVTLKVADGVGKIGVQGFYAGAILEEGKVEEGSLKRHLDRGMVEAFSPEPPQPPADDGPKKPGQNDPKAVWVDYAVSQDVERDDAEEMSKADLIDLFK